MLIMLPDRSDQKTWVPLAWAGDPGGVRFSLPPAVLAHLQQGVIISQALTLQVCWPQVPIAAAETVTHCPPASTCLPRPAAGTLRGGMTKGSVLADGGLACPHGQLLLVGTPRQLLLGRSRGIRQQLEEGGGMEAAAVPAFSFRSRTVIFECPIST